MSKISNCASAAVLFVGISLGYVCVAFAGADPNPFPSISGYNLEGKQYQVPGDFQGVNDLVIVTFEREQQKDADGWAVAARQSEKTWQDFRYYEVTAMEHRNVVFRWWWDSFMRKGIHDPETRARTIVVYISKRDFRQQLSIADEKDIDIFLISHSGQILWREQGPIDDAKRAALEQQLASLHH